ncbi:hypothetical protein ACQKP1_06820 [Allorhizobium sp. NPDC080224]|uniref:hypothetical protein n=1 Tax=Allorhizobium sp. NPDC080224 TaxID=3390547 RepID=UPI003D08292C
MRQTKRKLRVLELLAQSQPTGVALLNEISYRYLEGEASRGNSGKSDRQKSFNRSVLPGFTGLDVHYLADKRYIYGDLTAGIFARWAVWELFDQKYISGFPGSKEMIVAVGKDACSAFAVLKQNRLAVIGPATFLKDIVVLGNRPLDSADIQELSKIPWQVMCFTEHGTSNDPRLPITKLARLPYHIELSENLSISTARNRLPYRR